MRAAIVYRAVGASAVMASRAVGQLPCDSAAAPAIAYQFRGDRCEGTYARDVAGTSSLPVHSLTAFVEPFNVQSPTPIAIRWRAPTAARGVRLRALPLRSRVFYAMETVGDRRGDVYLWPTAVLSAASIGPSDIGLVATTTLNVGGRDREVYLPLWVTQQRAAPPTGRYSLLLLPDVDVAQAFLTISRLTGDGTLVATETTNQPLGEFMADARMTVVLPRLATAGYYQVRVSARLENGTSANAVVLLYSPE